MNKDRVFADKKEKITPFEFNEQVAGVFDDMLNRSVPMYSECVTRQAQLARDFYQAGSMIYDLGCSHGNIGLEILKQFGQDRFSMLGVDSSRPMIQKYERRLAQFSNTDRIELVCGYLEDINLANASVVLINLTLQFLNTEKRDALMRDIYTGMNPGGILLLTEKTVHDQSVFEDLEARYYRKFKLENGYSELEISQKREALEKVLVPDTLQTHTNRLESAGFKQIDTWLKWFNFTSFMAVK